jgi:hypothetical protein
MTKAWLALLGLLSGCNVTPLSPSGGANLPERGDCPTGLALVSSDYLSSEVALLFPSGEPATPSLVSSAASASSGLAAALSGDIVVAPAVSRPGELAIVDRFGTNVITFIDTRTALVRAQLPVGTGFEANAQGYLELDEHHALVPRLGENAVPGREPFDQGSDLLIIEPSVPEIVGSLPMPRKDGYLPSPVAATLVGDDVVVTLQHAKRGFSGMAEAELVGVDRGASRVRYRLALTGSKNCGKSQLSPSRGVLGVACEGYIDRRGAALEPETSAFVLLDATEDPPAPLKRFSALELFGGPIQTSFEFVDDRLVLLKTQTALGAEADNRLFALDLESGATALLATALRDDAGAGFGVAFGGMSCAAGCGDPCLICDLSRGKLLRFWERGGALVQDESVTVHGAGLPPLSVTPFW